MKKILIMFLFTLVGCTTNTDKPLDRTYSIGEKRSLEQLMKEHRKAKESQPSNSDPNLGSGQEASEPLNNNLPVEGEPSLGGEPLSLESNNTQKGTSGDFVEGEEYTDLSRHPELQDQIEKLREDYNRQKQQIGSLSQTERRIIKTRFDQELNRINRDRELEIRKLNLEYDYIIQGIEKDYKKELSAIDNEEAKILKDLELELNRSILEEEEKFISDYIFNFGEEPEVRNESN